MKHKFGLTSYVGKISASLCFKDCKMNKPTLEERRIQFEKCSRASKNRSGGEAGVSIINEADVFAYDKESEEFAIFEFKNRQTVVSQDVC